MKMDYEDVTRIGVISDTHDRLPIIDDAIKLFAAKIVGLVVHCGDWKSVSTTRYFAEAAERAGLPVVGVLGNNDIDVAGFLAYAAEAPGTFTLSERVLELMVGNKSVAIYHGHHAPTLRRVRDNPAYDIVLLGHTHKPKVERIDGRLIVNPGSTAFAIPRSKQWQPTVAVVDVSSMEARIETLPKNT